VTYLAIYKLSDARFEACVAGLPQPRGCGSSISQATAHLFARLEEECTVPDCADLKDAQNKEPGAAAFIKFDLKEITKWALRK